MAKVKYSYIPPKYEEFWKELGSNGIKRAVSLYLLINQML